MNETLLLQEIDILDVLAHSTGADFDTVISRITYDHNEIPSSLERLLKLGYILEPREWRYQITNAGRTAWAYATYELYNADADPLTMVYAGLGAS